MVADNLKDYISSTTQPLSIILGKLCICKVFTYKYYYACIYATTACDDLYQQAIEFSKKSGDHLSTMQQLEGSFDSMNLDAAIEDGKRVAVRQVLLILQAEIEVITLAIKRRHKAMQKVTSMYVSRSLTCICICMVLIFACSTCMCTY